MSTPRESFYHYQHRRLGILLAWGVGCTLLGALGLLCCDSFWRQFGLQTSTWGGINATLALFGRRDARKKVAQQMQGTRRVDDERRAAQRFRTVLLVNAGLDVLYILGGVTLARRQWQRRDRRGVGLGIVPQGVFLLLYDSLLAWEVSRYMRDVTE